MNDKKQIFRVVIALVVGIILGNLFLSGKIQNFDLGASAINANLSNKPNTADPISKVSAYPWLDTTPPTNITSTSAKLNGLVNPNGEYTTVWFYVFSLSGTGQLQIVQETTHTPAGNGTNTMGFNETVSGLTPNANYVYEICASTPNVSLTCAGVENLKTKRGGIPFFPNQN